MGYSRTLQGLRIFASASCCRRVRLLFSLCTTLLGDAWSTEASITWGRVSTFCGFPKRARFRQACTGCALLRGGRVKWLASYSYGRGPAEAQLTSSYTEPRPPQLSVGRLFQLLLAPSGAGILAEQCQQLEREPGHQRVEI